MQGAEPLESLPRARFRELDQLLVRVVVANALVRGTLHLTILDQSSLWLPKQALQRIGVVEVDLAPCGPLHLDEMFDANDG